MWTLSEHNYNGAAANTIYSCSNINWRRKKVQIAGHKSAIGLPFFSSGVLKPQFCEKHGERHVNLITRNNQNQQEKTKLARFAYLNAWNVLDKQN